MFYNFRFWLLSAFVALQVDSFGAALPSSSQLKGLSYESIANLARNRYQSNPDGSDNDDLPPMKGRVAVITGAAGGIGGELAKVVYRLGGTVVALDRNATGLEALRKTLIEECSDSSNGTGISNDGQNNRDDTGDRIVILPTNHDDLTSVASSAETIKSQFGQIDLLVNNAGIYPQAPMVSAHGKDLAFTVNYLSHFLLTEKLLQSLSNGGRIVHVTSTFHWKVDGSDLLPHHENGVPNAYQSDPKLQNPKHLERSYGNSKLAQIWHSRSIYEHLPEGALCSSVCVCPSWAATAIGGEEGKKLLKHCFPVSDCGPAITSAINGMLRTDQELGDALNNGKSFVANSRILERLIGRNLLSSKFVNKRLGLRELLGDLLVVAILHGQKRTHRDFIIQQTSPESFNDKEKRDQFYKWSKEEIKRWL